MGGLRRPSAEDDPAKHRLPQDRRNLDHAPVGQELGKIAAHGRGLRGIRSAEVDQEDPDPGRLGHASDIGSRGSDRNRLPLPAWMALATAGARTASASPLIPPGEALLSTISTTMSGTDASLGRPIAPNGRATGIPATNSGSGAVASASPATRPLSICWATRPRLIARPQSITATSRDTAIR